MSLLDQHRFHTRHGTGVLIVTSSRESAIQISGLASELLAGTTYTTGMIMEGANRGAEEQKLDRGINLLIATPTRLLEHMRDTTSFVFKNLKAFCVYGADGFAADMQLREILTQLPKKPRVSVVLAGQAIEGLEGLVELVCRPDSLHRYVESDVRAGGSKETQGYVVVEADKRFLLLYSFLKKFQQKKIVVVAGSTQGALFAADMLSALDLEVHTLHGRQNVKTRTAAFSGYVNDAEGTLICTEEAVQGLQVCFLPLYQSTNL